MILIRSMVTASIFILAIQSLAGTEVTNGGSAIVCRSSSGRIRSAQVLDLYEIGALLGGKVDLGGKNLSIDQKFEIAMKRLERISPLRTLRYREQYKTFMNEAVFLKGVDLVLIPDAHPTAIPSGCKIEQLAVQKEPELPQQKRFTINQDIWEALDRNSKTALILHEIIYREAKKYGHTTSIYVRYLNAAISSSPDLLSQVTTQKDIYDFMRLVRFKTTDFNRLNFQIDGRVKFAENGNLLTADMSDLESPPLEIAGQKLFVSNIEFYDNRAVKSFGSYSQNYFDPNLKLNFTGHIQLYKNGLLKEGDTNEIYTHPMTGFAFTQKLTFAENSTLTSGSAINLPEIKGANAEITIRSKYCKTNVDATGFPYLFACDYNGKLNIGSDHCLFDSAGGGLIEFDTNKILRRSPFLIRSCSFYFSKFEDGTAELSTSFLIGDNGGIQFLQATVIPIGNRFIKSDRNFKFPATGPYSYNVKLYDIPGQYIVEEFVTFEDTTLPIASGGSAVFTKGTHLKLNKNGEVTATY